MLNKIVKLDQWIISRLAIEQVINSYLDIVKELVDNSIDGDSTHIKIYINFNKSKLEVVDNGIGMSEEDLKLCVLPHNTSKFTDFSSIKYLGFRGEGLYAIKESAHLEITTRMKNTLYGHCLYFNGLMEKTPSNEGTTVKVTNIFYMTPRKNAFINKQKEFIGILNFIHNMALGYPHIKFSLYRNDIHYTTIGQTDNIIEQIFNIDSYEKITILNDLFNIDIFFNKKPKEKKGKLLFFINRRPVLETNILNQIKKSIENIVGEKNLSFLLVFLNIDSSYVDFNITPSKSQVKISIIDYIKEEIQEYFKKNSIIKMSNKNHFMENDGIKMNYNLLEGWFSHKKKFIFAQYNGLLYVLDQHAISERLVLNQLLKEEYNCQMLLEKISVKLTEEEILLLLDKNRTERLKNMKFLFYQVDNYLLIYGIPSFLLIEEIENTIKCILQEEDYHLLLHKLSDIACKNSIKAGYILKEEELKNFLLEVDNGCSFCNHGRRTHIIIEDKKIQKWFNIKS